MAKIFGHTVRYAPFGWTALGLVVVFLLAMAYGYYIGRWNIKVKEIQYLNRSIPKTFDGFRIVHISDLHLSTFDDNPAQLEHFVDVINSLKPDIICFTGDLVTIGVNEALPYSDILKRISSRHGVISVLGNHDFLLYSRAFNNESRIAEIERLTSYQNDSLGWKLLRNSSMSISAPDSSKITFLGVDNKSCIGQGFKTIDSGDLSAAMEGTTGFRILLSHDPSHWDYEVVGKTDIPLTLSGHTHAAQIKIVGWSPASMMFKRVYGVYKEGIQTLIVNPGLGCTAPFRIGANPEIYVITLNSTNDD